MTIFHEALFSCFLNILVQFGLDKLIKTKYTSSPNVNGPEYFRCEFCLCKNNITKTPTKHFFTWSNFMSIFVFLWLWKSIILFIWMTSNNFLTF